MKKDTKTKQQLLLEMEELQSRLHATEQRLQEANEIFQAEVTERIRVEETFEKAQKYAEGIVETIREPLVVLTADLKVISANHSFYQTFEVSPKETEGRFIYSVGNHQWDIPVLRKLLEEIVPQNTHFNDFEVDHEFPAIGHRTMILNARRIHREDNGTEMILLAIEDITERKQSEEAVKISETRYRRLFETAQDGILILDADTGKISDVNPFLIKMLGYSHDHFLGRKLWEIGAFKDIEASRATFSELQNKGYVRYEDLPLETRDGRHIDVEFVSNVYLVDHKKVIQCNIRDITDRKRAERALENSQRFLVVSNRHTKMKSLLEEIVTELKELTGCAAVGIRILDEEGNIPYKAYEGFSQRFYELESPLSIRSDQCVCINVIKGTTDPKLRFYTPGGSFYMNGTTRFLATVAQEEKGTTRNVCNQFGYESVALIPIRCEDQIHGLIHVADTQENKVPLRLVEILEGTAMQLCQAIQRVRAEEALRKSHDELEQRVEERTVKLRMANEQLKQEIEERKKVEDSLKESEKKLRYLSSRLLMIQEAERRRVSRELHDELGGTLAVLKLRLGSIEKNLKEDQRTLREECDMSLKYIDKLFESVHRISRNLSPSILEDLGLSAALRWLIDDFGKNYNVRVILEIMDTDHLFSNETQIGTYRIIQEALTNIGKHAQAKNVSVMIKKHNDMISLLLEDDGRGFNMKQVSRKGATEKGLGLATMVERAKMLGGSLDLWSQEGKGTRITLSIPVKRGGIL